MQHSIISRLNMIVLLACLWGALLSSRFTDGFVVPHNLLLQKQSSMTSGISTTTKSADAPSKAIRLLNTIGLRALASDRTDIGNMPSETKTREIYEINSVEELDSYFADDAKRFRSETGKIDYDALLKSLSVKGDTQIIGSINHPEYIHPVAQLLHERKQNGSICTEGKRSDGCKVALIVEGGGMRGCISAGMICALHHLGLRDTVDVVYGASAGSIIGAYFITNQLPWFGPEVYYDKLTTAGKDFIDSKRLLRSLGFGMLDPRLIRDVLTRPQNGKPGLNLAFLLKTTLQKTKALNWEAFAERQKVQPLYVVASAVRSEETFVRGMKEGHFSTFDELSDCMHASCLLPGIAGPVMNVKVRNMDSDKPKFILANNLQDPDYEPLGDALVYGPIPYEEAFKNGATHAIVIRSRPDGTDVTGKGGLFEKLIFRRFFVRKNKLPKMFHRMTRHLHKKLYAKNVIELNREAFSTREYLDTSKPHVLTIALPPGSEEVTRLETRREAIFEGVRRGFARAYDALVLDPAERGRGAIVAKQYFPDEILEYDPTKIDRLDDSAFSIFMEESGIAAPKSWDDAFTIERKAKVVDQ
jgi:predicted acylesterase/phospholipase RssA